MSPFELFAFFGAPLLMFAGAMMGVLWYARTYP